MAESNVNQLGDRGKGIDPRTMLEKIMRDVDDIECVSVIIKHKDGEFSAWSTSGNRWWLWAVSGIAASEALKGIE